MENIREKEIKTVHCCPSSEEQTIGRTQDSRWHYSPVLVNFGYKYIIGTFGNDVELLAYSIVTTLSTVIMRNDWHVDQSLFRENSYYAEQKQAFQYLQEPLFSVKCLLDMISPLINV